MGGGGGATRATVIGVKPTTYLTEQEFMMMYKKERERRRERKTEREREKRRETQATYVTSEKDVFFWQIYKTRPSNVE